jgi:hypothetical protein
VVDRRIGLEEINVRVARDRPASPGDNPCGGRLTDTKRVPNSDHGIADGNVSRRPEVKRRQVCGIDPEQRDIRRRVRPHDPCGELAAICEPDQNAAGAADHVTIGHDQAVRTNDEPRPECWPVLLQGCPADTW